jgi:hypothetical protein
MAGGDAPRVCAVAESGFVSRNSLDRLVEVRPLRGALRAAAGGPAFAHPQLGKIKGAFTRITFFVLSDRILCRPTKFVSDDTK